jgi:hypothetical protein
MNRKAILIGVNHTLLMFGTTVYMGLLWSLHFFWYPSWEVMNVGNVPDHFVLPTNEATRFFTIVVPIMFVGSAVMIWQEWKTKFRWHAIISMLGIAGVMAVRQFFIIPVNSAIAAGVSQAKLTELLAEWMLLNDIRWYIVNVMWLALMIYFLQRPSISKED